MAGEQFTLSLTDFSSLSNETTFLAALNANFQTLEDSLNDMYMKPFNPTSGAVSAVTDTIDMDSNTIINLPDATTNTEPVTFSQFTAGTSTTPNTILSSTGAPDDTADGIDGDFYIDTATDTIYGPKASGSWPAGVVYVGATGATGATGADGSTVLSGSGAPTTEGSDGDFYIDTDNLNIYGPKASGTWPLAATRIVTGSSRAYSLIALGSNQAITTATVSAVDWSSSTDESTWQPADGGSSQRFWLGNNGTFTTTHAAETITKSTHGFTTGEGPLRLTNSGGALPTGFATATDYWVIVVDANTFKLATTRANAIAGTTVTISDDGTGTHSIECEDWLVIPAGVTVASFYANIQFADDATGYRYAEIALEGGQTIDGTEFRRTEQSATDAGSSHTCNVATGPIVVAEGERYKVNVFHTKGSNLNIETTGCNFSILVNAPLGGSDGKTVLNGSGVPSDSLIGDNGDFYIDTTNVNIYGPKAAGLWGSATSLQGGTAVGELSTYVASASGDLGPIIGKGDDSAANETDYYTITPVAVTGTNGAEDGRADISAMKAGSDTDALSIGALTSTLFGIGLGANATSHKDIGGTFYPAEQTYSHTTTTISSDASITFTTIPSAAKRAIYRIENLKIAGDDKEIRFQFTNSGTPDTSAIYDNVCQTGNSDDNTNGHGTVGSTFGFIGQKASNYSLGNATDEQAFVTLEINQPNDASNFKEYNFRGSYTAASGRHVAFSGGGIYQSNTAIDGIKFFMESGGNLTSGTIEQKVVI